MPFCTRLEIEKVHFSHLVPSPKLSTLRPCVKNTQSTHNYIYSTYRTQISCSTKWVTSRSRSGSILRDNLCSDSREYCPCMRQPAASECHYWRPFSKLASKVCGHKWHWTRPNLIKQMYITHQMQIIMLSFQRIAVHASRFLWMGSLTILFFKLILSWAKYIKW